MSRGQGKNRGGANCGQVARRREWPPHLMGQHLLSLKETGWPVFGPLFLLLYEGETLHTRRIKGERTGHHSLCGPHSGLSRQVGQNTNLGMTYHDGQVLPISGVSPQGFPPSRDLLWTPLPSLCPDLRHLHAHRA